MPVMRLPVNITWPGLGGPGVNVWHIRTSAEEISLPAELQAGTDAIRQFYNVLNGDTNTGASYFRNGTQISAAEAIDVETKQFYPVSWTTLTSATTQKAAPPQIQACVTWRTSIAARRGMGRTFVGPLQVSTVDTDGSMTAAFKTALETAASNLVDASGQANGWGIGVYGLEVAGPGGDASYEGLPRVLRDFTGYRVRDQFATLNRRRD